MGLANASGDITSAVLGITSLSSVLPVLSDRIKQTNSSKISKEFLENLSSFKHRLIDVTPAINAFNSAVSNLVKALDKLSNYNKTQIDKLINAFLKLQILSSY